MKKNRMYGVKGLTLVTLLSLSGCLKSGLEDLPAFTDAKIVNVFTEYRFKDPVAKNFDGSDKVNVVSFPVARTFKLKEDTPGATADSVLLNVTVPATTATFTAAIRNQVTAQNLVVYCNISTAATITPLESAPRLGAPGDFSVPRSYKVTAADGTSSRTWIIKVTKLNK